MVDIKKLSGVLNLDDREADILQHQHIHALNGRFYGGANGMTFENVKGNDEIVNTYLVGTALENEMIGGVFDQVHQRIFWFNWNQNQFHGIFMYDIASGIITPLLRNFINSSTDILHFQLDYPVSNPLILYTTEADGDVLYWTIRNQKPKQLNIKEAITGLYGANWLEEYLDVAKEPIFIPPVVAYEDDGASTVNNLRKKLFLFQPRYWYHTFEKSTYGAKSDIPVPVQYVDPQVDTDPTKNCRIAVSIQTGDASVTKIEIIAFESLGNVFSKGFSVIILDKALLSIPNNSTYIYRFYNNEAYEFVDLNEQLLDFSRVPDTANDQALINGNVLAYAGLTEGKDPVIPSVIMDIGTDYPLIIPSNTAYRVTQFGLDGFQTDEQIKFVFEGVPRYGDTPQAKIQIGGTTFTITYTIQPADTNADVMVGLSTSAIGQGFAQISLNANELIIYAANQRLLNYALIGADQRIGGTYTITHSTNTIVLTGGADYLQYLQKGAQFILVTGPNTGIMTVVSSVGIGLDLSIVVDTTVIDDVEVTNLFFINPLNNSIPVYNASSKYNYGLVYFDSKSKSNGVTTSGNFGVTTDFFNIQIVQGVPLFNIPVITGRIAHRPPLWAETYQWVRSPNLSKESFLYWISDRTYKDDKFAYISVESINAFKKINKNSVISYDFISGDRIKFYMLYNPSSQPTQVYGNEHDYEIVDQVINPDINGTTRTGQFLKIVLPDLDVNFNFGTGLSLDYYFYYIELYTPAKSAAEGLGVYYEFSEQYGIGNPGTTLAFHQGQTQNQSTNLVTPAIFQFNKGDDWYRTRTISVGNTILYDLLQGEIRLRNPGLSNPGEFTLAQHLQVEAYETTDYMVAQDVAQMPFFNTYLQPEWTISMQGVNTYDFRVKGALNLSITQVTVNAGPTAELNIRIKVITSAGVITVFDLDSSTAISVGSTIIFDFDTNITVPPNSRVYLILGLNLGAHNFTANIISGFYSFTEPNRNFEVGVIDQNFSDFFASKVNSNGRPWTVNPDEKTTFFGTLIRYGGQYQQNTNINQINIFYPNDLVEAYRSWGDIQRMIVWGTQLRVFQERRVGYFGIYAKYIQTSDADSQITTTNNILTPTNIQYMLGEWGLGKQYTGIAISKNSIYFIDPVRGYQIRWAADGLTPISELYKGQYFLRTLWVEYNGGLTRPNGGSGKIIQFYDTREEQCVCILQGGESPKGRFILPYTFSFHEMRNGYASFYSYFPDWAICAEDEIYSWKTGKMYVHNSNTYCRFYGEQFSCSITLVFNTNTIEKKTPESIAELASAIWACPLIYTNVLSYGTQRQESELIEQDFAQLEGMFEAAFLRDSHSIGSLINGDFLKANWICVKFEKVNASDLIFLTEVKLMYKDSPLTSK